MTDQQMPARIWSRNDHPQFFYKEETFNSTPYVRSDLAERMAEALEEYVDADAVFSDQRARARSALSAFRSATQDTEAQNDDLRS